MNKPELKISPVTKNLARIVGTAIGLYLASLCVGCQKDPLTPRKDIQDMMNAQIAKEKRYQDSMIVVQELAAIQGMVNELTSSPDSLGFRRLKH